MPNIKSIISTYDEKLLHKPVNQNTRKCNCTNKNTCSLNKNCVLENILYIATIKSEKGNYQHRNYKGISANIFKIRYPNHKRSFGIDIKAMRNYPLSTGT